jgi:excisionase family DNA binding protein
MPKSRAPEARTSSPEWVSLDKAAQRLDCSRQTLRRMIAAGEIPAYRVGKRLLRVDMNDLLRRVPTAGSAA